VCFRDKEGHVTYDQLFEDGIVAERVTDHFLTWATPLLDGILPHPRGPILKAVDQALTCGIVTAVGLPALAGTLTIFPQEVLGCREEEEAK
jgi:hypothetical protein